VPQGLDQGTVDITVTGLPDQGFRSLAELPGQGFGLGAGRLDNLGSHGIAFQRRGNVLGIFQQADGQVAVVVLVRKTR
jgi:hypothetical protein